jgi:hypothetical protein
MWFDTFLWRAERTGCLRPSTKVGYPTLVDVQQAPGHLALAEGDEGKAAMTADKDGHAKREAIGSRSPALVRSIGIDRVFHSSVTVHVSYTC